MKPIIQIIDTLNVGGAQKLLVTMAEVLRRRDETLTVISLDNRDSPIQHQLHALNVPVLNVRGRNKLFDPQRVWQIAEFLRQGEFDVIHTHLTHANILGTLAGRLAGVPVAASLHNVRLDRRQHSQFKEWLENTILRYCTHRVIAVGYVVEEAYRKQLGGKRIEVIPNAVSAIPALPLAERLSIRTGLVGDPERPLLIAVGRLTPQKGYPDLFTALTMLRQSQPSLALIIAGEGRHESKLRQQIADLSLSENVFLLGRRDDVPDLLAASDIYVSAALWEGLSVATLEAMAAGLPVVATSVGEVPRMIVAGAGIVVPPRDPAALAQALASLLDSPASRQAMGVAARAYVLRHHEANAWVQRLLRLYAELRASARPVLSREHI
ncbi:MAG TPA: glycosyltransferase [Anaerolineae bacterium]